MKYLFIISLSLLSTKALMAQVYIHNSQPIVVGQYQINKTEETISYRAANGQIVERPLSEFSEETTQRMNDVKQNEVVLFDGKMCQAFYVALSGRAELTCRTGQVIRDGLNGVTNEVKKMIVSTAETVAEVKELDGIRKKDFVTLQVPIDGIQAGDEVRVEAIFANGEVLIKRSGFMRLGLIQSGGSLVRDVSIIRAHITDLCKCKP